MSDWEIIKTTKCEYGVIRADIAGRLVGLVEKPDILWCSDGMVRFRNAAGMIIDDMTHAAEENRNMSITGAPV